MQRQMGRRGKRPKTSAELDEAIGSLTAGAFKRLGFDGVAKLFKVPVKSVREWALRSIAVPDRAELIHQLLDMLPETTSPLFAKLPAARRRVGSDNLARLKWLLAFAQDEHNEAPNLAIEVFAFAAPSDEPIHEPYPPNESFRELTPEKVKDLAEQVRAGIQGFHRGREWRTPPLALAFVADNRGRYYQGRAADCFLAAAVDLAIAEKARTRVCEWSECKRLFVKNKRALYCSRQCSAKNRFSRWRHENFKSDEDFSLWRHERYKARQPRAKIRRR
jgi:hypothetical protein